MSKAGEWKVAVAATVLASAFAAASAQSGAATLYRWTDANGTPVISDRPPPQGTAYNTLDGARYGTSGSLSAPQKSEANAAVAEEPAESDPAPEPESNVATTTVVEKRPDLCEQAKDNVFKLETFPRIRTTDDDGTVRFMTEEEVNVQMEMAKKAANAYC